MSFEFCVYFFLNGIKIGLVKVAMYQTKSFLSQWFLSIIFILLSSYL